MMQNQDIVFHLPKSGLRNMLAHQSKAVTDRVRAVISGFKIEMATESVKITIDVEAIDRAHWAFEQTTIGGLVSNFTYNEYPLKVVDLLIEDANGKRGASDYEWIRGNAEHSWGILH